MAVFVGQEYTRQEARELDGKAVRWWTPLDNYEVTRTQAAGYAVRYTRFDGTPGFKFWPDKDIRDARRAVYVLDDGKTAVAYYVAGWQQDGDGVILQPFPVNPDGKRRTDNGELIDYGNWALGPRRMYHLKISAV